MLWHNIYSNGKDGTALEQKIGYRLLIVEDDCLMAEGASDYFTAKGWEVEIASEGEQALEILEQLLIGRPRRWTVWQEK